MKTRSPKSIALVGVLFLGVFQIVLFGKDSEVVLNANGENLQQEYARILSEIETQVAAGLPTVDAQKKAAFETARAELGSLKAPSEDAGQAVHKATQGHLDTIALTYPAAVGKLMCHGPTSWCTEGSEHILYEVASHIVDSAE